MDKLEKLSNKNIHGKRMVGESLDSKGQSFLMDVIIMLKEAYFDIQEYSKKNKIAGYDLAEAMGNLRGAIKMLGKIDNYNQRQIQGYYEEE